MDGHLTTVVSTTAVAHYSRERHTAGISTGHQCLPKYDGLDYQPLAALAATGNGRAWTALWEKLHASRKLQDWAKSWFSCREDAEDAASEALLRAMQRFSSFHWWRGHFLGWIYRIAGNEFARHLRHRVNKHIHSPLVDDNSPAVADGALPMVTEADDIACLETLLNTGAASLSARQRTVVWKVDVERMSHREVAGELGISYAYSRKEYSRARKKLGEAFPSAALQAYFAGQNLSFWSLAVPLSAEPRSTGVTG